MKERYFIQDAEDEELIEVEKECASWMTTGGPSRAILVDTEHPEWRRQVIEDRRYIVDFDFHSIVLWGLTLKGITQKASVFLIEVEYNKCVVANYLACRNEIGVVAHIKYGYDFETYYGGPITGLTVRCIPLKPNVLT